MGVRSPYLTITFPNHPPQDQEYLDFRGVPAPALERWKRAFLWFLKRVTVRSPKRIVLKSPPHTARIRVLLEMFPKAKFVHIVRDPYVIFPSTVNLWKRLYRDEGLQMPTYDGLEEHVFATFTRMYEAFERDRGLIGPGQFCEIRYEDLVADPIGADAAGLRRLELGDFEAVRPAIEKYFAGQKDYKTNRYQITPEMRADDHSPLGQVSQEIRLRKGRSGGQGRGVRGTGRGTVPTLVAGRHNMGLSPLPRPAAELVDRPFSHAPSGRRCPNRKLQLTRPPTCLDHPLPKGE